MHAVELRFEHAIRRHHGTSLERAPERVGLDAQEERRVSELQPTAPSTLAALSVVRLPMARSVLTQSFGEEARPSLLRAIEAQDRLAELARQNAADLRAAVAALDSPRKLSVLAG